MKKNVKKSICAAVLLLLSIVLISCAEYDEENIVLYTTNSNENNNDISNLDKVTKIIKETTETISFNVLGDTNDVVDNDEEVDLIDNDNINELFGNENVVETTKEVIEIPLNEAALEVAKNTENTIDMTPAPYIDPAVIKAQLTEDVKTGYWTYGKSPITWVYVRPNTKLVSNYRPNGSPNFSINSNATSGDKGCFLPILTGTENASEYYEGRFFVFGDSSHDPNSFRYINSLSDLVYKNVKIDEILRKKYDIVKNTNGLLETNGTYINIVYVQELDSIINE